MKKLWKALKQDRNRQSPIRTKWPTFPGYVYVWRRKSRA